MINDVAQGRQSSAGYSEIIAFFWCGREAFAAMAADQCADFAPRLKSKPALSSCQVIP
ncbi:hypothetical protein GJ654_00695 [Rhodoblastus acidophilus]|uniref:Uncharacterized protein n=1 Tax=Rhodoblastus acidophilus TaxID=1074 RepID=A0A6N8DJZ2_RHOAC|nr:hypothetical protein [Rhodoblastus acidophilus]MCW2272590.1 hypothetical protein [Rhodoblastus acidophilus]MTV29503.1 hypothetical protein [Rhodoblastus acidophilus]